jgi:ABC-type uncharacterized transport system substrate-binding protein
VSRPLGRCLTLLACLTVLGLGPSALAHPHVRISVEATFVVEGGALTTIRHRWTFDEEFGRSNLIEFDANQNGVLDEDELSAFRELSLDTLKRFDSFTIVWQGAVKIKLREPVLVRFDLQAAKPVYEFTVALSEPVPLMGAGASIEVYDPTYFSAFDFRSDQVLSVESKEGTACSAALASPPRQSPQMKEYRAFVTAFGPLSAKLVTPRSIKLSCRFLGFHKEM